MILLRRAATIVAALAAAPAAAMPGAVQTSLPAGHVLPVQSGDIPDVVRLLAQRAARAERRADMETANELYRTIRDLGYIVRRPDTPGNAGEDQGHRGGFDGDEDERDDDDRDDNDGDDGDYEGDDGGDSDGGDSDGGDGDGGDGDGD